MASTFHAKVALLSSIYPLSTISSILGVAIIVVAIFYAKHSNGVEAIPLYAPENSDKGGYKKRWQFDNSNLLKEAYNKFGDRPFRVWTSEGYQIGLHPKYAEEVKMLPDTVFPSALRSFFLGTYLWPIEQWKLDYPHIVLKNGLAKNLTRLFPDIRDVIDYSLPLDFPECKGMYMDLNWTAIQVHPRAVRVVTRISTRVFVGNGMERNEDWLDISSNYTKAVFIASAKLRYFHPIFRPLVQYFISDLRTVWQSNRRARNLLAPIIARRQVKERNAGYDKPNDCIQWVRDLISEPDRSDAHLHAIIQLAIASVSVGSTSHLITNIIFNLATWPEFQTILKNEIDDALVEAGGEWTVESMGQLKKLDSFMKESLRFNGHVTTTFQRLARKDVNLSDGTRIPAGTMVFIPAFAIANDPSIYQEPDTFDGLRFYNLRQRSPEDEKKWQFTTVNKEQMQFGMGRHACSGRWMASYQIKLVLANLISKYEFRLKDGTRPKNTSFMTNLHPDLKGEVLFKNRK
ncbi:cytochrome P450 [Xylogone sp. PMI_703]|nr:cytochrome P450 [Xylogone sp. PMI_703]